MSEQGVQLLAGERQKGESSRAIQACNDWLRMGPGRTIVSLWTQYRETPPDAAPTRSKHTLEAWSKRHGWAERGEAHDALLEAEKNERKRVALEEGLALVYERVIKLKALAEFLEGQLYEQGEEGKFYNVWVPDVKSVGSGDHTEIVDIERFNAPLIEQYRDTLDDLAQEMGGRVKKADVTSGGKPIPISVIEVVKPSDDSDG